MSEVTAVASAGSAKPTESPEAAAIKKRCEQWSQVFRGVAGEIKCASEFLVKWTAYDQGVPFQAAGSKWTREEEELLRQALELYGDNMDKICEALSSRSEQAIRAAIKRKMDPAMIQKIGPLRKRHRGPHVVEEFPSPLASYFVGTAADPDKNKESVVEPGKEPEQEGPENSLTLASAVPKEAVSADTFSSSVKLDPVSDTKKPGSNESKATSTGWVYPESGVELNDHDFLALLEDDPLVLTAAMTFTNIPPAEGMKVRPDPIKPEDYLEERNTESQDFMFLHNHKKSMFDFAVDLGVYRERDQEPEAENDPWLANGDESISTIPTIDDTDDDKSFTIEQLIPMETQRISGSFFPSHHSSVVQEDVVTDCIEQDLLESAEAVEQLQNAELYE